MLYRIAFFCLFCISLYSVEHVYLKTPRISRQEIIGTNVGIRPYRKTGVRLEVEWLLDKTTTPEVIDNMIQNAEKCLLGEL